MHQRLSTISAILLLCPALSVAQPGSLDPTFDPGGGFDEQVFSLAIQPDGKAIVGGRFSAFDGAWRFRICRLNADGSLDTGFQVGAAFGTETFNTVYALALQPDGKVIAGGTFNSYNGTPGVNCIARLNSDGSLDTTYHTGTGFAGPVMTLALQDDGKVLAGGYFQTYDGDSSSFIIRLLPDGARDTSFHVGTGFDAQTMRLMLDPDGRVIVTGVFLSYDGTTRMQICRLLANGEVDPSFDPGGGCNGGQADCMAFRPNGDLVVGGIFTTYNGLSSPHIVGLLADGSHDPSFALGTAADDLVRSIVVQPDGRVVVAGWFNDFNGVGCGYIIRLNSGGSHDASFTTGTGFGNTVRVMALRPDGRILCGGFFNSYNGVGRNCIAQLNGGSAVGIAEEEGLLVDLFPNPAVGEVTVACSAAGPFQCQLIDAQGRVVRSDASITQRRTLDVGDLSAGLYTVRITNLPAGKAGAQAQGVARLVVE